MPVIENADGTATVLGHTLGTEQIGRLIHALLVARSRMTPAVPMRLMEQPDAELLHIGDPAFAVAAHGADGVLLAVRHPGAGWLGLRLDKRAVSTLHAALGQRLRGEAVAFLDDQVADPDAAKH
jgi:hypothetical protein